MKRFTRHALLAATVLTVVGLAIFLFALIGMGFDFRGLDTSETVSKTHTVTEDFSQIRVELSEIDLRLVPSESGTCYVESREHSKMPLGIAVENGALVISEKDERRWYDHVGVYFEETAATVYLPKKAYERLTVEGHTCDISVSSDFSFGDVEIKVTTGDVSFGAMVEHSLTVEATTGDLTVANMAVGGNLNLKTDTGDITLRSVAVLDLFFETDTGEVEIGDTSCENLFGKSQTGDVTLKNATARAHLQLETDTGRVELLLCDAASLRITTDTGDVNGVLLSDKSFTAVTDTGDVDIPRDTVGGGCEIETDTGDIKMSIVK